MIEQPHEGEMTAISHALPARDGVCHGAGKEGMVGGIWTAKQRGLIVALGTNARQKSDNETSSLSYAVCCAAHLQRLPLDQMLVPNCAWYLTLAPFLSCEMIRL